MADVGVAQFFLGVLGGLMPTAIWQLGIAPRRERFNLAKVLRTEIHLNIGGVIILEVWRANRPKEVINDFSSSRIVFDALAGRVAEFPVDTLAKIIRFYQHLEYLDSAVSRYHALINAARDLPSGFAWEHRITAAASIRALIDDNVYQALRTGEGALKGFDSILADYWENEPPKLESVASLRMRAQIRFEEIARQQQDHAEKHFRPKESQS